MIFILRLFSLVTQMELSLIFVSAYNFIFIGESRYPRLILWRRPRAGHYRKVPSGRNDQTNL